MDDEELLNLAVNELIVAASVGTQPLDAAMHALRSLAASTLVAARASMSRYDLEVAQWRGDPHR